MNAFKVTLLGVGGSAGSPQIGGEDGAGDWGVLDPAEPRNRRTRPSIVIESPEGKRLLVDTGPDLRLQLTDCKIPRIDAVLYTHAHADHVAGLDEIRILNRLLGAPMPTYATQVVFDELEKRFDYAFRPWNGSGFYRPVLSTQGIEAGQVVEILGLAVQVIGQDHGYITTLGLRVGGFAYCTDVVRLDETALAALEGLEVLVIDCFTNGLPHPTHANLEQVLGWVEVLRPKRTILTHMGPTMDYQSLLKELPEGVEPGFDGMVIEL
ncbi:MAG: MBL fold metallo-hydrolase [Acidocella sp. 35-58-6]|nr:MAG: MBL fold metallo-hydrolase [Acidocella sp. 35-58-6]